MQSQSPSLNKMNSSTANPQNENEEKHHDTKDNKPQSHTNSKVCY